MSRTRLQHLHSKQVTQEQSPAALQLDSDEAARRSLVLRELFASRLDFNQDSWKKHQRNLKRRARRGK